MEDLKKSFNNFNNSLYSLEYFFSSINFEKEEALNKVKKILKANNIEMSVSGCGCCDSAVVSFSYKGNKILDDMGNANFSTSD